MRCAPRSPRRSSASAASRSSPICDQLDFLAGAYAFVSIVYVPPVAATLACLPVVLARSIAATAVAWALGLKEAWI